jgi:hypothetical protein
MAGAELLADPIVVGLDPPIDAGGALGHGEVRDELSSVQESVLVGALLVSCGFVATREDDGNSASRGVTGRSELLFVPVPMDALPKDDVLLLEFPSQLPAQLSLVVAGRLAGAGDVCEVEFTDDELKLGEVPG